MTRLDVGAYVPISPGTRSGSTMDEKFDAPLSKFVHFETQIAQIPVLRI